MALGNALAEYQQALKLEGLDQVLAVTAAAKHMAEAIEEHIVGEATKASEKLSSPRCPCGHRISDHSGNYSGSRACDHCSCPAYPLG